MSPPTDFLMDCTALAPTSVAAAQTTCDTSRCLLTREVAQRRECLLVEATLPEEKAWWHACVLQARNTSSLGVCAACNKFIEMIDEDALVMPLALLRFSWSANTIR